jgi:hypothetical protein
VKHPHDPTGYRRIWAAVVYQAIRDMESEMTRRPAIDWLYSDKKGPQSMRWICDMLDLDYDKLLHLSMTRAGRARILRWSGESGVQRKSPRAMIKKY